MQRTITLFLERDAESERMARLASQVLGPGVYLPHGAQIQAVAYDFLVIVCDCRNVSDINALEGLLVAASSFQGGADWKKLALCFIISDKFSGDTAATLNEKVKEKYGDRLIGTYAHNPEAERSDEDLVYFLLLLKYAKEQNVKNMNKKELIPIIEEFLKSHNTMTLVTGSEWHVRGTPVEYWYDGKYLYVYSEGGEKFAWLHLNSIVSAVIYDPYSVRADLAGIQIHGKAEILDEKDPAYSDLLIRKGFKREAMAKIPLFVYIIRITPYKYEMQSTLIKELGYDIRQIVNMNDGGL